MGLLKKLALAAAAVDADRRRRRRADHRQVAAYRGQSGPGEDLGGGGARLRGEESRRQGRDAVPRERGLQGQAADHPAIARPAAHHLQLGRRRAEGAGRGRRARGHHRRRSRTTRTICAPGAVAAFTVDGKIYGLPHAVSQVGFMYNKELFAKAGVDGAQDQDLGRPARRGEDAEGRGRDADRGRRRATNGRCISTGPISRCGSAARPASRRR